MREHDGNERRRSNNASALTEGPCEKFPVEVVRARLRSFMTMFVACRLQRLRCLRSGEKVRHPQGEATFEPYIEEIRKISIGNGITVRRVSDNAAAGIGIERSHCRC